MKNRGKVELAFYKLEGEEGISFLPLEKWKFFCEDPTNQILENFIMPVDVDFIDNYRTGDDYGRLAKQIQVVAQKFQDLESNSSKKEQHSGRHILSKLRQKIASILGVSSPGIPI